MRGAREAPRTHDIQLRGPGIPMTRSLPLWIAAALCLPASSIAQHFNVDVGTGAVPSSGFGGAAAQPGVWNSWVPSQGPLSVVDLLGAPTGITLTRSPGFTYDLAFDNTGTSGDDEALLDDFEDPGALMTYTIAGLQAGTYTVTTYAWAPDSPTYVSNVSVNGGQVSIVGGTWTGTYQLWVTHAVDTVTIAAGGTIDISVSTDVNFASFNGLQVQKIGGAATSFCSGDGSGTACPCGNAGAAGNGCASSISAAGARLSASGIASIGNDTFVLAGSLMPDSAALYFQGSLQIAGGMGVLFGDGLRCVGGTIIRLDTKINAGGASTYPGAGDAPISVKGANSAGAARNYQVWYRNAAAFCTGSTFNLTNGVATTWAP